MEQHAVPQHIASFEFKLFGNLTLKQFVTLAIPMSFAIIAFFSNLNPIIRYSIAFFFGGFGFFAALVPINGKSFDKWIVAFINAILSPTLRVWIKEEKLPEFLMVVTAPPMIEDTSLQTTPGANREKLIAYIQNLPKESGNTLDKKEQIALNNLGLEPVFASQQSAPPIFISAGQAPIIPQTSLPTLSSIQLPATEGHLQGKLGDSLPQLEISKKIAAPQKLNPHAKRFVLSGVENRLDQVEIIKATTGPEPKAHLASDTNYSVEQIVSFHSPTRRISFIPIIGKTRVRKLHFAFPVGYEIAPPVKGERTFEVSQELKKRFDTPETPAIKEQKTSASQIIDHARIIKSGDLLKPTTRIVKKQEVQAKNEPPQEQISPQFKFPIKSYGDQQTAAPPPKAHIIPLTSKPNVLSGIVSASNDLAVEGVILIVHDQNGIPVRALKTNKLGQFISATPLPDGKFTIEVEGKVATGEPRSEEREEKYDAITLNLNGQILSPMEIKAKGGISGSQN